MKSNKSPLLVWAILASVFLLALISVVQTGPKFVGKSYVDTEDFKANMNAFYENIGPTILNPIDMEEAEKTITVEKEEIEAHRSRYGTLSEQIANIQDQYTDRIADAEAAKNEKVKSALIEARDMKMDDIRKNFESDAHVEAKIRAEKASILNRYLVENHRVSFESFPVVYEFKDTKTGETFSSGDIDAPAAYKRTFDGARGYFTAQSLPEEEKLEPQWVMGDSATELEWNDMLLISNPARTFEGKVIVPKSALKEGLLSPQVKGYNQNKYFSFVLWLAGALALATLFTKLRFNREWVTENRFAEKYDQLKN